MHTGEQSHVQGSVVEALTIPLKMRYPLSSLGYIDYLFYVLLYMIQTVCKSKL